MASEGSTDTEDKMSNIRDKRQEMLEELQNQISDVDEKMASLAVLFDILYNLTNCQEMQRNIKRLRDQGEQNEDNTIFMDTAKRMSDLIQPAKNVENRKVETMKSLSKLIHFIHADREEICTDKYLDKCKLLTIDEYLTSHKCSNGNGDALVEMLQEQNKRLQQKYKLSREHVHIVSEREKITNDELNRLRKRLENLKVGNIDVTSTTDTGFVERHFEENKKSDDIHSPTKIEDGTNETTCSESGKEQTGELQVARDRITKLETMLEYVQKTLTEKEDLLKSVVLREVYDVNVITTRKTRSYYPELNLQRKIKSEMTDRGYECNFVADDIEHTNRNTVSLIACATDFESDWERSIKKAKLETRDSKLSVVIMLYSFNRGEHSCEEAQKEFCQDLSKFRVFTAAHNTDGAICSVEIQYDIVDFIIGVSSASTRVMGCRNCNKACRDLARS